MSSTLDLLGGPFSPQSLVGEIIETTTPTVVDGTVFPFDPDKMPDVNPVTGVPDLIAAPPLCQHHRLQQFQMTPKVVLSQQIRPKRYRQLKML